MKSFRFHPAKSLFDSLNYHRNHATTTTRPTTTTTATTTTNTNTNRKKKKQQQQQQQQQHQKQQKQHQQKQQPTTNNQQPTTSTITSPTVNNHQQQTTLINNPPHHTIPFPYHDSNRATKVFQPLKVECITPRRSPSRNRDMASWQRIISQEFLQPQSFRWCLMVDWISHKSMDGTFPKKNTLQWVQIMRILLKFLEKLPFVLHRNSRSSSPCFRRPSLHHAFGSNPLWPPWRQLLGLPGGVYTKMSIFEDLSTLDFWDWWSTQIAKHLPNKLKFHWKVSNLDWYAS